MKREQAGGEDRARHQPLLDPALFDASVADGLVAFFRRALAPGFRESLRGLVNPYGDGHAAPRIAQVLGSVELGPRLIRKRFVDLP